MIEYLKGTVSTLSPTFLILDVHGVGYFLNISLSTYTALEGKSEAQVLVHEAIREDAYQLFGFSSAAEREAFRLLISVSGIGAGTARLILSSLSVEEFTAVIAAGDVAALKKVKGIGARTAERAIVDLRDKISQISPESSALPLAGAEIRQARSEAMDALLMLGFHRADIDKVLTRIFTDSPTATTESAIKSALRML